MFRTIFSFCIAALIAIVFSSCGHTNQLREYELSAKKVMFITNVVEARTSANMRYDDGRFGRDITVPERVVTGVGSVILESEIEEKLAKVFEPENVAGIISDAIKDDLRIFIAVVPVDSIEQEPDLIGETNLHGFRLISGSDGVSASITAEFILTERGTGKIIWRNKRTVKSPLQESVSRYVFDSRVRKAGSVINAMRLAEMSEEEIEEAISVAASEVSYDLLTTLRRDISNSAR